MADTPRAADSKARGAYYTPPEVARALVDWAVVAPGTVLDPACGDGAFLVAALRRLAEVGGGQVHAVEVDGEAARAAAAAVSALSRTEARGRSARAPTSSLLERDFLEVSAADLPRVDAVVGNPPFVRFQRLTRAQRAVASERSAAAGVALDPLASYWAPFLIHATTFLQPGGRLALVVPAELGHARYAKSILAFLAGRFRRVRLVTFAQPLFPHLDQHTLLLLAEGHGRPGRSFALARVRSALDLAAGLDSLDYTPLDTDGLTKGSLKLHHAWLKPEAAEMLSWLRTSRSVSRLGHHARAMIGYVTGANDYFHLEPEQALELGLGASQLRRAVFRSRALEGLAFTDSDWLAATESGDAGLLFAPSDESDAAVSAYLQAGAAAGVHARAKARHRTPWYRVTRTAPPDLMLTAMASASPRLSVNDAQVAVCNTLHGVWRRSGSGAAAATTLAAASLSSLSELSAELEGHALGGGLLKLEPSAAQALLLPLPAAPAADVDPVQWRALERLVRRGDRAGARAAADAAYLVSIPGVGVRGAEVLADAAATLRTLRQGPRAGGAPP